MASGCVATCDVDMRHKFETLWCAAIFVSRQFGYALPLSADGPTQPTLRYPADGGRVSTLMRAPYLLA